jgi:sensor histidine kinase YesM
MNNSAEEASYYLKLYSDFTNRTLSDIERPARTVAEEVDYVRGYLELEKLRYGEQLEYDVNVARDVDREALLPTMLLHTYCENAVKHGISAKNGTGHIHVNVSRETRGGVDGILVSVADDGVGRIRAAMSGGHSTKQGLSILQQQIELYNRSNRHHIVQQVIDLADAEGHPAGTRFETWVPEGFQF